MNKLNSAKGIGNRNPLYSFTFVKEINSESSFHILKGCFHVLLY